MKQRTSNPGTAVMLSWLPDELPASKPAYPRRVPAPENRPAASEPASMELALALARDEIESLRLQVQREHQRADEWARRYQDAHAGTYAGDLALKITALEATVSALREELESAGLEIRRLQAHARATSPQAGNAAFLAQLREGRVWVLLNAGLIRGYPPVPGFIEAGVDAWRAFCDQRPLFEIELAIDAEYHDRRQARSV